MNGRMLWRLRWHILLRALVIPDLSRRLPLPRLLAWFTPAGVDRRYAGLSEAEIVREVRHRLRSPWRMRGRRCLREGLLVFHFLRLAGIPAVLRFGVFHQARGSEKAHCWVEVGERAVTEPPGQPFVLIWTHDPSAASAPRNRAA